MSASQSVLLQGMQTYYIKKNLKQDLRYFVSKQEKKR